MCLSTSFSLIVPAGLLGRADYYHGWAGPSPRAPPARLLARPVPARDDAGVHVLEPVLEQRQRGRQRHRHEHDDEPVLDETLAAAAVLNLALELQEQPE